MREKAEVLVYNYPEVYYRATQVLLYPISAVIGDHLGNYALGMHTVSLLINTLTLVSLYYLLLKITQKRLLSFLLSAMVFTMPGRSATFFWGSTQVEMLSILSFFIVLNVHFSENRNKLFSSLMIFTFSAVSVLSYEITVFLPLVFIPFYFVRRDFRTIVNFLSSLVSVIMIIFYKFYLYPHFFHLEVIKKISEKDFSLPNLLLKVFSALKTIVITMDFSSLFIYWEEHVSRPFLHSFMILLVFLLIILISKKLVPVVSNNSLTILIIGVLIIVGFSISVVPIFSIGATFSFYGKDARFTSFPAIGFGLIIGSIFCSFPALARNGKNILNVVIALTIIFNYLSISNERRAYIKSWVLQRDKLESIDYTNVPLYGDKLILVHGGESIYHTDYKVPVFADYWSLSCALSLYSGNPNVEADFTSSSYIDLSKQQGYQISFWDKKYYTIDNIFYINIEADNPIAIPLTKGVL